MKKFSTKKKAEFPAARRLAAAAARLSGREKAALALFFVLFLWSASSLLAGLYRQNTEERPAAGGKYVEGMVGQPRFLNPIYAPANDADQDITELLFSGLMKHDGSGRVVPDLAEESPKISEGGTVYEFRLKENALWHDGKPLTADDVVFTIETLQNSDYKSPIRANFLGLSVEKTSKFGVRFRLKNPYYPFLERATVKIIPKHIWEKVPPENFLLSPYNLNPVGSGPYKIKSVEKSGTGRIKSVALERNRSYFGKKPNISEMSFLFFKSAEEMAAAAAEGKIDGLSLEYPENARSLGPKFQNRSASQSRYFAVFLNPQKSKILADKRVRRELNYGTDKKSLIAEIFSGTGFSASPVNSPILPEIYGFVPPEESYEFNPEKAEALLEEAGFKKGAGGNREKAIEKKPAFRFKSKLKKGSGGEEVRKLQECLAKDKDVYPEGEITGLFGSLTEKAVIRFQEKYRKDILDPWGFKEGTGLVSKTTRAKLNEICFEGPPPETMPLKFTLVVPDQPQLIKAGEILREQWGKIGVETEISRKKPSEIEKKVIKPRDYEMLLFGEILEGIPDPFPFWHSSQKRDPGLNLSLYENKKADGALKKARQALELRELAKNLEEFQNILIKDAPAVFLYRPDYAYFVSRKIKGVSIRAVGRPAERFSEAAQWYIKTKRAWK